MNRSLPLLAALAAMLAACAHGTPPLRQARLQVAATREGTSPWVEAQVAGQPVRLLVDTGATQSLLPASFATANRLKRRASAAEPMLIDANGRRVKLGVAANVPVTLDGTGQPFELDFLLNPSLATGEGVLAPQELLRRGWAMTLDLEGGLLRFDPEAEALARLAERGPPVRMD